MTVHRTKVHTCAAELCGRFRASNLETICYIVNGLLSITLRLPQDTHRQLIIVIIALITAFVNKVADEADSRTTDCCFFQTAWAFGYTVCQRIEWLALVDNGGFDFSIGATDRNCDFVLGFRPKMRDRLRL